MGQASLGIILKRFVKIITFNESRKVCFAIWLFLVSTVLCVIDKINSSDWLSTMFLCAALIGGGTVADKWLESKHDTTRSVR